MIAIQIIMLLKQKEKKESDNFFFLSSIENNNLKKPKTQYVYNYRTSMKWHSFMNINKIRNFFYNTVRGIQENM